MNTAPINPGDVLSAAELAELLGRSVATVREMCSARGRARMEQHPLPFHRMPGGRAVYFIRSEVSEWLLSNDAIEIRGEKTANGRGTNRFPGERPPAPDEERTIA